MSDEPWYAEGLRFRCTQCGNCCTGGPGAVWVEAADLHRIAEHRGTTYGEILIHHTRLIGGRRSLTEFANGDCTFFDPQSRRCTIYAARPAQCRTWPFWPSHLQSRESWERVGTVCPGVGSGDFIPLQTIQQLAAECDL